MDFQLEAAQRVGKTLCNKWTLERLLGTGGMAAVYVAVHKIGRREAIKILHTDVAQNPELRARFEQEAHAVNRFKHPGAVEIRDIDVAEDGSPFLVMELLEGESLSELSRRPEGVPLPELLRLTDELLDVLVAAHAQGIIHRDIKPDNLFVQRDGRLKVLDFGIARVRAGVPKLRTRVGAKLGTAPYMPPEQIKGQEIDGRADLFAVGATMFRLLAKRRVHEAPDETELLAKMASEQAPRLASVAPEVPEDVAIIVDRALMFDRDQRYPDAATMQADVRAAREGKPPPYAHARLLDGTPPPSALRRPSVIGPVIDEETTKPGGADEEPLKLPELTAAAMPMGPITLGAPQHPAAEASVTPLSGPPRSAPRPPDPPPASAPIAPAPATPVATGGYVPGAERTLRSEKSPDGSSPPRAAGYVVAAVPHVIMPARAAGGSSGPRTVPEGTEPAPPDSLLGRPGAGPLPGESIPVVQPSRSRTLAGSEPNVGLLVLVGVLFAALGVGLTLWFMLSGPGEAQGAAPVASAEPVEAPFPGYQRPHTAAPTHVATPPPAPVHVKPHGR